MATNPDNVATVYQVEEEKKQFLEVPNTSAAPNAKKEAEESAVVDTKKPPPDGGYGWVVLFAVFMIGLFLDGIMYSFGTIINAIKEHYQINDKTANFLVSLYTGLFLMSGPIVSAIINQFGCQVAIISGAFVTSMMYLVSIFVPSFFYMYFTIGIVGGIATGLFYISSLMIIPQYFDKKKGMATGIAMCGSGIGFFIGPPLLTNTLAIYGWKVTLVACSGILMINALLGFMAKPLNPPKSKISFGKKKKMVQEVNIDIMSGSILSIKKEEKKQESIIKQTLKEVGDFSLLFSNWRFLCATLSNFFIFSGYFLPYVYMDQIPLKHGVDKDLAKWIVSVSGIVNIPGRLIFGYLGDAFSKNKSAILSPILLNTLTLTFGLLPLLAYEPYLQYHFWSSALFSGLYALSTAGMVIVTSLYLIDFVGIEKYNNANGIVSLFRGFGCMLGPWVGGMIADRWNPAMAFYFVAGCFIMATLFSAIPTFIKPNEMKFDSKKPDVEVAK